MLALFMAKDDLAAEPDTLSPARNFSLSASERISAAIAGRAWQPVGQVTIEILRAEAGLGERSGAC